MNIIYMNTRSVCTRGKSVIFYLNGNKKKFALGSKTSKSDSVWYILLNIILLVTI